MSVLQRGIRVVLFDVVGTVMIPRRPVSEVYHDFGQRFGSQRTIVEIRQRFHEALARYVGKAVQPRWDGKPVSREPWLRANTNEQREMRRWSQIVAYVLDDAADHRDELFQGLWNHFSEAAAWQVDSEWGDVRAVLERRGYQVGLASNFDQRLVQLCRQLPPLRGIQHLFCSSQLGVSKPDPRFYRTIELRTHNHGSSILLVGDDPLHDVEVPRQLGWQTLQWSPQGTPRGSGPDSVPATGRLGTELTRFSDLLKFLV